jgi:HlyD family secretion protein
MSGPRLAALVLVVAALLVGVWAYLSVGTSGSTPKYRTAVLERGPLTASVSATGSLNAVVTVQVGSQVSGQISELHVDYNSPVTRGQLIARIEPSSFEAKLNQATADVDSARANILNQEAALEKARADVENMRALVATARANTAKAQVAVLDARRNLDRTAELLRRELVAQSDKDAAQAAHDSAVAQVDANRAQERAAESSLQSAIASSRVAAAQLEAAKANLKQKEAARRQAQVDLGHTYIRAPVDGVVVSRNVDVGQTVAASLQAPVLFTIAQDLSRMQVDTSVDEADIGRVRIGQRATFTVDSFPGERFSGEVNQIRKAALMVQNVVTYTVVINVDNPGLKLLPGMTANVQIVIEERPTALKVPNAALRFRPPEPVGEPARADGHENRRADGAGRPLGGHGPVAANSARTGQVWVLDPRGTPTPVVVTLGITDGSWTEVTGGDVTEGTPVLVGLRGGPAPGSRSTPAPGPRLRL